MQDERVEGVVEGFDRLGDAIGRYQYDESLLALADGMYVGYITYYIFTRDSTDNPEVGVKMVEVLEDYRRRGVGAALYDEMVAAVSESRPRWDGEVLTGLKTTEGAAFFSSVCGRG